MHNGNDVENLTSRCSCALWRKQSTNHKTGIWNVFLFLQTCWNSSTLLALIWEKYTLNWENHSKIVAVDKEDISHGSEVWYDFACRGGCYYPSTLCAPQTSTSTICLIICQYAPTCGHGLGWGKMTSLCSWRHAAKGLQWGFNSKPPFLNKSD